MRVEVETSHLADTLLARTGGLKSAIEQESDSKDVIAASWIPRAMDTPVTLAENDVGSSDPPSAATTISADVAERNSPSSDEEGLGTEEGPDPLYDARADDSDARWVQSHLVYESMPGENEQQLHCPSCFALLSLQCQPHEYYAGQFRAVFVQNCVVNTSETVRVRVEEDTKKREGATEGEEYRPVSCKKCFTDVAVLDREEVYHFCNVMY
jgi:E2F-associated phosphoprotein